MEMKFLCVLLACLTIASANPKRLLRQDDSENYAATASKIITTSVLKGVAGLKSNYVFSPFGFSTILGILSEGARGQTLKEINEVLKFSDNIDQVRKSFNDALANLQGNDPAEAPQFKTWMYVYKNNSIDDYFRNTIRDYYFVEVKDIERTFYDFDEPKSSETIVETTETVPQVQKDQPSSQQSTNSKDIIEFESLKKSKPFDEDGNIDGFEDLKVADTDDYRKETSKFDKVVDQEKQYVEVPTIKKEIEKEKQLQKVEAENEVQSQADDVEEIKALLDDNSNSDVQDAPERIEIPLKKFEDFEIMQAVESKSLMRRFYRGRSMNFDGDVTSALSANSMVGEKINSNDTEKYESKMLLFNGLYFRGAWAHPFQQLQSEDVDEYFHKSATEKQPIKFMRNRAVFKYAKVEGLDAEAIELPYANERYALLMLVPNKMEGLTDLMMQFNMDTIPKVCALMEPESVQLRMPKFTVETTGRIEKALSKLGLITIFTSKADLSGLTSEQNLHIDELVQHVGVRVDEGSSSESALTASNILERSGTSLDKTLTINRPFMFVLRDVIDDFVIAAGKILDVNKVKDEF